ncbi:hypothetical protein BH23GEM5_BH23GEM5_22840 [soil metagenome]
MPARLFRLVPPGVAALSLAAVLAGCERGMPTAPEVERMDVAAAEAQIQQLKLVAARDGKVTYYVNGKQVSAEEARTLGGDRIAQLELVRGDSEGNAHLRILTRPGMEGEARKLAVEQRLEGAKVEGGPVRILEFKGKPGEGLHSLADARPFEGLIVIDGVASQSSDFRGLGRDQIEKIEVIKGDAAARQYSDPRAAQGVIRITTKAGATKR